MVSALTLITAPCAVMTNRPGVRLAHYVSVNQDSEEGSSCVPACCVQEAAWVMHPPALEEWNLSEGVMVTQKPRAVLTAPQRFWQLLQFVCDDDTSNVWSVTQGRKQETSLLTTGDASSRSYMHFLSFSSPYPSYLPEASIFMALTRSVWAGLTLKYHGSGKKKKEKGKIITAI